MNFKKVFCIFLSVLMIITAFSAVAVGANAENGMPDAAFGGGQPPEKPDGEMPGEPPEGMGGPGGGMGTPPDGAPGGDMGTPPDGGMGGPGGMPGGGPGSSSDIDYSGAVEITSADSQESLTYETSAVDQSALLIRTAEDVSITNPSGRSGQGRFHHDHHRRHHHLRRGRRQRRLLLRRKRRPQRRGRRRHHRRHPRHRNHHHRQRLRRHHDHGRRYDLRL